MFYILVIVTLAGHIYQDKIARQFGDNELYRTRGNCEEDLARIRQFKPKKGVNVVRMSCEEAHPDLNYQVGE